MIAVIAGAVLLASLLLTRYMLRVALARGLLDIPNARSSHQVPTPRGGGLAIVLAATAGFLLLAACGLLELKPLVALTGGGALVALVGFIDDHRPLRAGLRLLAHVVAAVWALLWLGGLPPLQIGQQLYGTGLAGYVLGALGIVWTLNLFNFMDGIDGIAGSEAVFVTGAGGLLCLLAGHPPGAAALIFAAACCGFLVYNWPPARIFMGDVGSGYIGYCIAVLALAATCQDPAAVWQWLILGGVFFVDATVTLIRRGLRGERVLDAHRSHAYQWLARHWKSHRKVTLANLSLNLLWLLPCAILATLYTSLAFWALIGALLPVILLVISAGAGRKER